MRSENSGRSRWGVLGGIIAGGAAVGALAPMLLRKKMAVTLILRKDHRVASGLLKTLERTPRINGTLRGSLLRRIHTSLMAHEMAEDEVLYPAIRDQGAEPGPRVQETESEQNQVRDLLDRLAATDPMSDRFDERFKELKQSIQQHADREERWVFPWVETHLSRHEQERLGERLRDSKKRLKSQALAA